MVKGESVDAGAAEIGPWNHYAVDDVTVIALETVVIVSAIVEAIDDGIVIAVVVADVYVIIVVVAVAIDIAK